MIPEELMNKCQKHRYVRMPSETFGRQLTLFEIVDNGNIFVLLSLRWRELNHGDC